MSLEGFTFRTRSNVTIKLALQRTWTVQIVVDSERFGFVVCPSMMRPPKVNRHRMGLVWTGLVLNRLGNMLQLEPEEYLELERLVRDLLSVIVSEQVVRRAV